MTRSLLSSLVLAPIALLAVLSGCGENDSSSRRGLRADCSFAFPKAKLCAELVWKTKPEVRKLTEATLRFFEADGDSKKGPFVRPDADVNVPSPFMPTMGHDSGKTPKTTRVFGSKSDYKVENVWFNMVGPWAITVELKKDGRVIETSSLSLRL